MDIWVNPKQENKLRKEGWTIPKRPDNGRIFYKGEDVDFSDDFIDGSLLKQLMSILSAKPSQS